MGRTRSDGGKPRPFLKWAGGKGQLLPELAARVASAGAFQRYHEPFLGGGALFFEMVRTGTLRGQALLSDGNAHLIDAWQGVRDCLDDVIVALHDHREAHGEEHYYTVRAAAPATPAERAARVIYLNRTCYNGLWRENSKGRNNVPFGRYTNPTICDEANLRAVSAALQGVSIEVRSFETVLEHAKKGDLVYFDPPYVPLSKTASFTAYSGGNFGMEEQARLAEVFAVLAARRVKTILSNSWSDAVWSLYKMYRIDRVSATRNVNSRGDRRGKVSEVLVTSFK